MGNKNPNLINNRTQPNIDNLLINKYSDLMIVIFGYRGVGKSSLFNSFRNKNFSPEYMPTIGKYLNY